MGTAVLTCPAIKIVPPANYAALDKSLRKLSSYDWLIFTSANAVEYFMKRYLRLKITPNALKTLKTCALGPLTAIALRQAKIPVSKISKNYVAESVLDALPSVRNMNILIPQAQEARKILSQELRKRGAKVDVVTAYRTVVDEPGAQAMRNLLSSRKVDCVTFTSSSTVKNFFLSAGGRPRGTLAASIGPITTKTLLSYGWKPAIVARKPTTKHLAQAILNYFKKGIS